MTVLTAIFVGAMVFAYAKDTQSSNGIRWGHLKAGLAAEEDINGAVVLAGSDRAVPQKVERFRTIKIDQPGVPFEKCGAARFTCVVDGDTFWLNGTKFRIADIDAPEISSPMCDTEYAVGMRATDRLIVLLNLGRFQLLQNGDQTLDGYGRTLAVVVRDGNSLGLQLVSEGLARTWKGPTEPWC